MKRFGMGLLAAASLAVLPAIAQAQNGDDHRTMRADGGRGWRAPGERPPGGQGVRPQAPPLVQAGHGAPPAPGAVGDRASGLNRPPMAPPGEARPQWQGNRGNWGGRTWNRGDARPVPPQATGGTPIGSGTPAADGRWNGTPGQRWQRDGEQQRSQWQRDRRSVDADALERRRDQERRENGANRQWTDRDHDADRNRWNGNDRRIDNDGRRWDGAARRWGDRDRNWQANRSYGQNLNWRNDHRYDWRNWRDGHRDLYRWRYNAPRGFQYRPVSRGFFLEPFFFGSNYWLDDPFQYRLPPVQWPLQWIRYYDEALLVDVTTGEVIDSIQGFFG